jgi:hypothetical protein
VRGIEEGEANICNDNEQGNGEQDIQCGLFTSPDKECAQSYSQMSAGEYIGYPAGFLIARVNDQIFSYNEARYIKNYY